MCVCAHGCVCVCKSLIRSDAYFGEVIDTLLEGEHDDLFQHCHGLLTGRAGGQDLGVGEACEGEWEGGQRSLVLVKYQHARCFTLLN